ncbi:hypothetical protein [Nonomuraea sp. NPDC049625]|uniref:hypothetical protein n=1 Tax=Nonomuraea sp. NPDC049625 TaxID=3155775 RepID=UPI00343EE11F
MAIRSTPSGEGSSERVIGPAWGQKPFRRWRVLGLRLGRLIGAGLITPELAPGAEVEGQDRDQQPADSGATIHGIKRVIPTAGSS